MTSTRRVRSAAVVAGVAAVVTASAVSPARADDSSYVKYYTVTTSYQGSSENLSEIATRFLGSPSRSVEIYNLNVGRDQPDGKSLGEANKLDAGWELALPWDAVGPGVQYGTLPNSLPTGPTGGSSKGGPGNGSGSGPATPDPSARVQPGGSGNTRPGVQPSSKAPTGSPAGSSCATGTPAGKTPDWARQAVDASAAWSRTKGTGELVAVVDSGVDGSLAQLSGHVTVGVDVVSGNGRGDVDCLGTGTGMAAIVAARPASGGALAGVAPDATVMPVRVVANSADARADDEATAISVATASGATVIALGSYVDTSNAKVVAAIRQAVDHDVVVVCGAPAPDVPVSPDTTLPPRGVLRVGGVGEDGRPAGSYQLGSVDVQAPGGRVSTLGMTGTGTVVATGTQYAVAFVAGEAALIRAAYPNLPATGVTNRVKETAKTGSAAGGAKMMDPQAAVTAPLAAADFVRPSTGGASSATSGSGRVILLALIGLVLVIALVLMVSRVRRVLRADDADDAPDAPDENAPAPPWPVPPEVPAAK